MLRNEEDGTERGSLLWLLDHTRTPAGGRLMRSWVAHPLTDGDAIAGRLDAVEELSHAEADGSGAMLHRFGNASPAANLSMSVVYLRNANLMAMSMCCDEVSAGSKAGGLGALPALLSGLPDVERGITRILHRTASPSEFVTTMRALAGVGATLRLATVDGDGCIVVDASVAHAQLLRQLLEAAASPEVTYRLRNVLATSCWS